MNIRDMSMEDQIIVFGFCNDVPATRRIMSSERQDMPPQKAADLIDESISGEIKKCPSDALFVLSGGVDSSILATHASKMNGLVKAAMFAESRCSEDLRRARIICDHIGANLAVVHDEEDIIRPMHELLEMDPTLCTSGDLFSYIFAKGVAGRHEAIVVGDGCEFHAVGFGWHDMLMDGLIAKGMYDVEKGSILGGRGYLQDIDFIRRCIKIKTDRAWQPTNHLVQAIAGREDIEVVGDDVDSGEHALAFCYDWAYDAILGKRAKMLEKVSGSRVISPLNSSAFASACARVPIEYLWANGWRKCIVKETVRYEVPHEILDLPKSGFRAHDAWHRAHRKQVLAELEKRGIKSHGFPYMDVRRLMISIAKEIHGVHVLD